MHKKHLLVYNSVMGRTQVYLGDEELDLLNRLAKTTGASRSELTRRAVRLTFGEMTRAERIDALNATAGAVHGWRLSGADYVDILRGDLNQRLHSEQTY
jgi:Arc/MetJ-type ribon-helix-helix transcriptional regulator